MSVLKKIAICAMLTNALTGCFQSQGDPEKLVPASTPTTSDNSFEDGGNSYKKNYPHIISTNPSLGGPGKMLTPNELVVSDNGTLMVLITFDRTVSFETSVFHLGAPGKCEKDLTLFVTDKNGTCYRAFLLGTDRTLKFTMMGLSPNTTYTLHNLIGTNQPSLVEKNKYEEFTFKTAH